MQEETQNKKKVSMDLSVGLRTRKKKNVSFDLSVGIENCPIDILCTQGTQQGPRRFKYVKCNVRHGSAALKLPGIFKDGEYCKRVCGSGCGTRRKRCPCAGLSMGGLPPYEADGLLHPHYIEMVVLLPLKFVYNCFIIVPCKIYVGVLCCLNSYNVVFG